MQQEGGCDAGSNGREEAKGGPRVARRGAAGERWLFVLLELVGELKGGLGGPRAVRGLQGQRGW